jgi:hypothetical protein
VIGQAQAAQSVVWGTSSTASVTVSSSRFSPGARSLSRSASCEAPPDEARSTCEERTALPSPPYALLQSTK